MYEPIDYEALAGAVINRQAGMTTKAPVSSTPSATYGHGPGGLFSLPGMSRQLFSAMSLPHIGLMNRLSVRPSMDLQPFYGILTGVTATSGSEPTGVCDEPPIVGLAKLCTHTFVFGRMSRKTKVYDIDRIGKMTNRAEFADYQLAGNPQQSKNPNVPTLPGPATAEGVAKNELNKAMFEFGVAWARDFARDIYSGNPSSNTSGGGRTYYYGLDMLINTGYRDAVTLQACPAADSIIYNFSNGDITNGAEASIVRRITDIYRRLKFIAATTGLDPVKWVLTMPWSLFYELTAVWPCAYQTYRCQTTGTNDRTNLDRRYLNEMTETMRGDMYGRTGQYLLIDGERVEVVIDDSIPYTYLPGESFSANIYFVPLTVLGGIDVTYMEYINYDSPGGAMDFARVVAPGEAYFTSDGGRFLWHRKYPTNFCVELLAKTEPRLMFLTPQVAARLNNVKWTPLTHERDWDTASSYFVNGGRTDYQGYGPSFAATPTA